LIYYARILFAADSLPNARQERNTSPSSSASSSPPASNNSTPPPFLTNELLENLKAFNSLTTLNRSLCQFNRFSNFSSDLYKNSTTGNCFCQTIYNAMNVKSEATKLLYEYLSPMFVGKILYAPNTPAYAELIRQANATFKNTETFLQFIGSIADLANFTLDSFDLDQEESLLQLTAYLELVQRLINANGSASVADVENAVLQVKILTESLYFARNLGFCIELDKFVGYASESEAVSVGGDLLANANMWGVMSFLNVEKSGRLPDIVSYKIRMNSSLTHNTQYTMDRVYYYGSSNCIGCNAYYTYGFIYMQDIIEKGNLIIFSSIVNLGSS
jgi:hypothetical protein